MSTFPNSDIIRKEFTVNEIKLIVYSMIDSLYDIVFNSAHRSVISSSLKDKAIHMLIYETDIDYEINKAIHLSMNKDLEAGFPGKFDNLDFHSFIREFINSYYKIATRAIRNYTGSFNKGRLYPDDIATNGCKAAYLFVHERHPKHKLNTSASIFVNLIVDDIFEKEKNLGEI